MRKLYALIFTGIILVALYFSIAQVYPFNWSVVLRYRTVFLKGLLTTMSLSGFSLLLSLSIGIVFALMRRSIGILKEFAILYIFFFRNTPLLVVILLTYYGLGSILPFDRFWAAVFGLSAFEGAYLAEIIRSGLDAVDKGELEAGFSLGLTRFEVFLFIHFPQAIRISLPALVGQSISLVKDSSLASVIALAELTMTGRQVGTQTLASFESYLTIAIFYVGITSVLSAIGNWLERRLAIP
ncbi:MAG TPA: amino acid ABC transporter permease [Pseudothermotoga sp.]|nr:amino acid ABC transporter permease [Pseudothermotoga sp.]HOK83091.1 amino acid ABC transporter permease [Pseudothermotoga sp.]HPP69738.1 amino acid ABC transporter permease [Pseudothermotoga sp.]